MKWRIIETNWSHPNFLLFFVPKDFDESSLGRLTFSVFSAGRMFPAPRVVLESKWRNGSTGPGGSPHDWRNPSELYAELYVDLSCSGWRPDPEIQWYTHILLGYNMSIYIYIRISIGIIFFRRQFQSTQSWTWPHHQWPLAPSAMFATCAQIVRNPHNVNIVWSLIPERFMQHESTVEEFWCLKII